MKQFNSHGEKQVMTLMTLILSMFTESQKDTELFHLSYPVHLILK